MIREITSFHGHGFAPKVCQVKHSTYRTRDIAMIAPVSAKLILCGQMLQGKIKDLRGLEE